MQPSFSGLLVTCAYLPHTMLPEGVTSPRSEPAVGSHVGYEGGVPWRASPARGRSLRCRDTTHGASVSMALPFPWGQSAWRCHRNDIEAAAAAAAAAAWTAGVSGEGDGEGDGEGYEGEVLIREIPTSDAPQRGSDLLSLRRLHHVQPGVCMGVVRGMGRVSIIASRWVCRGVQGWGWWMVLCRGVQGWGWGVVRGMFGSGDLGLVALHQRRGFGSNGG
jgi:hypothetical protein